MHGRGAQRRTGMLHLRHRDRRRDRRLHRLRRRLRLLQPRRHGQRLPDMDAARPPQPGRGRQALAPQPAGRMDRGRPEQLPHRVPRLQRIQRGHAAPARSRLQDHGRGPDVDRHQRQPARRARQLADPRPVVPQHPLRRHRRGPVRDLRRRRALGPDGHRLPGGRGRPGRPRQLRPGHRGGHARPRRVEHDRHGPRPGACHLQG